VNLDEDVILTRFRIWHVASPHAIGASVTIEDECLHDVLQLGSGRDPGDPPLESFRIREDLFVAGDDACNDRPRGVPKAAISSGRDRSVS
jgi:hypothetical protein